MEIQRGYFMLPDSRKFKEKAAAMMMKEEDN